MIKYNVYSLIIGLYKVRHCLFFWLKCDSPSDDKNPTGSSASLTDGIDLVHKNDAWLVVSSVVEHLSDQPGTLTDVLVHNRAGHHLWRTHTHRYHQLTDCTAVCQHTLKLVTTLTLRKLQSS